MDLVLFSNDIKLCDAWYKIFRDASGRVEISHVDFRNSYNRLNIDALVSPANSFGLMDGGFDKIIIDVLGPQVMTNVQEVIKREYCGEQPVGTAFLTETQNSAIPYLIHAPTMRTPMKIIGTNNCFYSTKAALFEAVKFNGLPLLATFKPIKRIAMTGMGTLTGGLDYEFAAKQMRLAYDIVMNPIVDEITWNYVDHQSALINSTHGR